MTQVLQRSDQTCPNFVHLIQVSTTSLTQLLTATVHGECTASSLRLGSEVITVKTASQVMFKCSVMLNCQLIMRAAKIHTSVFPHGSPGHPSARSRDCHEDWRNIYCVANPFSLNIFCMVRETWPSPEPTFVLVCDWQLDDLVRFCAISDVFSVLTVDPTFNLGDT